MRPLSSGLPYLLTTPSAASSRTIVVAEPHLDEALEDAADDCRLGLVDDQLAVLDVVAERRPAAHPHALLAGGGELVPDALADHLPLELGEGEQDVERQPAHRGGGVERLGDARRR